MSTTVPGDAPAAGSFYVTGGTLPFEAASYVPRQADHDLLAGLTAGEFCYVLNTRQMGKSSLMIRTAHQLRDTGDTVAVLDLTAVGQNLSPEQWYDGLLMSLAEQLHLEDALEDFWEDNTNLGPLQRFITAIGKVVLPTIPRRLVLFVDEIDAVRSLPFPADEFFAAIRECYNRRQTDAAFEKLAFCLLGVATPADLIQDTRLSPFNIGRRILLTDFTAEEAAPLARGIRGGAAVLGRVLYWTNGHPYMTQRLCRAIAEEPAVVTAGQVDALCERLFLTKQARNTDDNLAFVRNRLLRSEVDLAALLDLYQQVRAGRQIKDDETNPLVPVLRLSGVASVSGSLLRVRNRIYDRVFDKDWVRAHMPDAELRRQEAAYRRGVLRTAGVFTAVLLLMGMLSAWALSASHAAQASARTAKKALKQTQDALGAEKAAERQAKTQEQKASERASEASAAKKVAEVAKKVAERAARREAAADRLARKDEAAAKGALAETRRQTQVATTQAQKARAAQAQAEIEKRDAEREKKTALSAQSEAVTQKASAVAEKKNTQSLLRVADLQLAGQAFDSETGPAAVSDALLTASREGRSGREQERFEWRYQWGLAYNSPATVQSHASGQSDVAITADGVLTLLDTAYYLHRTQVVPGDAIWEEKGARPQVSRSTLLHQPCGELSPDGTRIAFGTGNGQAESMVEVQDAATLKLITSWKSGGLTPLTAIHFRRGGQTIEGYSGNGDQSVTEWDTRTGQTLHRWTKAQFEVSGPYNAVDAWSSDGRYRASANWLATGRILLTDMTRPGVEGYVPTALSASDTGVNCVAFSPDGKTLASGDATGQVILWDTASAHQTQTWHALPSAVSTLAFSPNGATLATGGPNGLIRLWNTRQDLAVLLGSFKGHTASVAQLRFSAGGKWLASSDTSGTARAWDLDGLTPTPLNTAPGSVIENLVFSLDGKWLASTNNDGSATLWDTQTWQTLPLPDVLRPGKFPGGLRDIRAIAFSPDGRTVATSGSILHEAAPASGTRKAAPSTAAVFVQFWDRRTGRTGPRWEGPPIIGDDDSPSLIDGGLRVLAFSPDGRTLAGGFGQTNQITPDSEKEVAVWDTATGRLRRGLTGFRNSISALSFSPDGRILAVGSYDKTVRCFDTRTWAVNRTFSDQHLVYSVVFSPDGGTLAIGEEHGLLRLTQTRTWSMRALIGHSGAVANLSFSPDGRTLASANGDRSIKLWDVATGRETRTLSGYDKWINRVAFSPAGGLLASGDANGEVRLWRAGPAARIAAWGKQESTGQEGAAQSRWTTPGQEQREGDRLFREAWSGRLSAPKGAPPGLNLLSAQGNTSNWLNYYLPAITASRHSDSGVTRLDVNQTGVTRSDVQFFQKGLTLENGRHYVLQLVARADKTRPIAAIAQHDDYPYENIGLGADLQLTSQWKAFRIPFDASGALPHHGSITFLLAQTTGPVWFKSVVLVPDDAHRTTATLEAAEPVSPAWAAEKAGWMKLNKQIGAEQVVQAARLFQDITARRVPGYAKPNPAANLLRPRYGHPHWRPWFAADAGARASLTVGDDNSFTDHILAITPNDGQVQVTQNQLSLEPGRHYILQFRARADKDRTIGVRMQRDVSPYEVEGLHDSLDLNRGWQAFRLRFTMRTVPPGNGELAFDLGQTVGTVQVADAILVPEDAPPGEGEPSGNAQVQAAGLSRLALPVASRWTDPEEEHRQAQALLDEVERHQVPGSDPSRLVADLLRPQGRRSPLALWLYPDLKDAAEAQIDADGGAAIHIRRVDTRDWHIEYQANGLPLKNGGRYTLQFRARTDAPQTIRVSSQQDTPPPEHNGLEEIVPLTTQWQAFRLPFQVGRDMLPNDGAIFFDVGQRVNTLQFADMILVPAKDNEPQGVEAIQTPQVPAGGPLSPDAHPILPARQSQKPRGDGELSPLPVVGFNADVIADGSYDDTNEASRVASIRRSITISLDNTCAYYAPGFNPAAPARGLPMGHEFRSQDGAARFLLQPAAGDNALLLRHQGRVMSALALKQPERVSRLAFLVTGLNGDHLVFYSLHFADRTSTPGHFFAPDNYRQHLPNAAISGFDRIWLSDGHFQTSSGGVLDPYAPALFDIPVTLSPADAARTLDSISFVEDGGQAIGANQDDFQNTAIFAVSAAPVPHEEAPPLAP